MKYLLGENGDTLIEVIISILLLAMISIPFLGSISGLYGAVQKGQGNIQANDWITLAAEEVKAQPFNSIIDGSITTPNYRSSKFTLIKNIQSFAGNPTTLKQVYLEIKDGTKTVSKFSFVIYKR